MSYTFAKVAHAYPVYIADFLARYPEVSGMSYAKAREVFMRDGFSWADHYARELGRLGVDAHEIVMNADFLQEKWAEEHGSLERGRNLVLRQLSSMKAEVVLLDDAMSFESDFVDEIRVRVPSVRAVLATCCAPVGRDEAASYGRFDGIMTCTPAFEQRFADMGIFVRNIPHAFSPTILDTIPGPKGGAQKDVFFAGTLAAGPGYHNVRRQIVHELVRAGTSMHLHTSLAHDPVKLWGLRGAYVTAKALQAARLSRVAEAIPSLASAMRRTYLPRSQKLPRCIRSRVKPPVFGREMYTALADSKIGLNVHIDAAGVCAGNIRMFETAGMGACLVTDHKMNMTDFFEPDKEVVTYSSAEECREKIAWLLDNPRACRDMARKGQQRVLADHTYAQRSVLLNAMIEEVLAK